MISYKICVKEKDLVLRICIPHVFTILSILINDKKFLRKYFEEAFGGNAFSMNTICAQVQRLRFKFKAINHRTSLLSLRSTLSLAWSYRTLQVDEYVVRVAKHFHAIRNILVSSFFFLFYRCFKVIYTKHAGGSHEKSQISPKAYA